MTDKAKPTLKELKAVYRRARSDWKEAESEAAKVWSQFMDKWKAAEKVATVRFDVMQDAAREIENRKISLEIEKRNRKAAVEPKEIMPGE